MLNGLHTEKYEWTLNSNRRVIANLASGSKTLPECRDNPRKDTCFAAKLRCTPF